MTQNAELQSAGPHRVKADSASAKLVEHMLQDFALFQRPRGIHQAPDRSRQQLPTDEDDVPGYGERDYWVQDEPSGEHDQGHPQDQPG